MLLNTISIAFSGPGLTINLHDSTTLALLALIAAIFFGIVAVVATVLVGRYQVRKQHGQKQITYQILADRSVIRIDNEVKGRVKIEFDGRNAENMSLVILKIWNSGDTAIKVGDYLEPVIFTFEKRKVLEVIVHRMHPSNLIKPLEIQQFLQDNKPSPGNEKGFVELPKFHLNPGKQGSLQDALTLKILLLDSSGQITPKVRIDEGSIAKFKYIKMGSLLFVIAVLIVASIIAFILLAGYVSFTAEEPHTIVAALLGLLQRSQTSTFFLLDNLRGAI